MLRSEREISLVSHTNNPPWKLPQSYKYRALNGESLKGVYVFNGTPTDILRLCVV